MKLSIVICAGLDTLSDTFCYAYELVNILFANIHEVIHCWWLNPIYAGTLKARSDPGIPALRNFASSYANKTKFCTVIETCKKTPCASFQKF